MPWPDFDATIDDEVKSVSTVRADIAGNRELIVTSGIVVPAWQVDTYDLQSAALRVFTHVTAPGLENVSAFVGLASIANEDTAFTFATDAATVTLINDELVLHVNVALLGRTSTLNRFSYQVVATVLKIERSIFGTISWDPGLYVLAAPELATLQSQLYPNTNAQLAGVLTPLVSGEIESYEFVGKRNVAKYRIVNPPQDTPIKVTIGVVSSFAIGQPVQAVRTSPDEFVTLTTAEPNAEVNFEIEDMRIK